MIETSSTAEAKVLRAIVAREGRHAAAERREARQAHAEASKPTPSTVGWSTKAPPRRKPSPIDRAVADAAAENKQRWRNQHPGRAASERALRKSRAEIHERWDHKAQGTPETHEHFARHQAGALARLYASGAIDAEQLASAVQIAEVAEKIGADVAIGTASLETRVDVTRSPDRGFYEALGAVRREVAYTRWRARVQGPIAAILDMLVGDTVGFTVVAARYKMHHRRAKRILIDALDLWPQVLASACKEIDPATLAAAHAGILG